MVARSPMYSVPAGLTKSDAERLWALWHELAGLGDVADVIEAVIAAVRELLCADGVGIAIREDDYVCWAYESAIAPLWKGRRVPLSRALCGWVITHRKSVVIEDVCADSRGSADAYRTTFVKSLAMVPIRLADPLGTISACWAQRHRPTARELYLLETLAGAAAVALAHEQLHRTAEQAIQVRDEFLHLASHELRTPLTPLKLRVQTLARKLERTGDVQAACRELDRIDAHVTRLERIVGNLLDISSITRGMLELERERVDLGELVREVLDRLAVDLDRAGISFVLEAELGVDGNWDRLRLEAVVSNLLSNAIKFGEARPIEVRVDHAEARARLVVRDHGIGISPEDQTRIFDRFARASSVRHYGGFGLGLWVARQVVEAHGGTIRVESQGRGSAFTVELPRELGQPPSSA